MKTMNVAEILKSIVRTQIVVFALAFFAITAITGVSLMLQYRLTAEHDQELVSWHLREQGAKIRNIAVDYAYWDDTSNAVARLDTATLYRDVTNYLVKAHDFAFAGIVLPEGGTIATAGADDHADIDFGQVFRKQAREIISNRNERTANQQNISGSVTWVMLEGHPHLAAISPIYTTEQFVNRAIPERPAWLVLMIGLDEIFLSNMALHFRLKDVSLVPSSAEGFSNVLPLVLSDGTAEVALAWNSRPLGIEYARSLIPLILVLLLALFVLGWHVLQRSHSVAASLDNLHHSTRADRARLRSLFDGTGDALVVHDAAGIIIDCNDQICTSLGCSRDVLVGQTIKCVFEEYPCADLEGAMRNGVFTGALRRSKGESLPVEIRLGRFGQDDQTYVAAARDISDRLKAEKEIWHKAHHDPLTDLPNRALFGMKLSGALMAAVDDGIGCALLYIDLDGFKAINDAYGHDAGDALLLGVADRFRTYLRASDVVARLGGDEFAVILPNISKVKDVAHIADGLIARLSEPYEVDGRELVVTASVGIALAPADGLSPGVLLQAADKAMYSAKKADGGRYHMASPHDFDLQGGPVKRGTARRGR